MSKYRILIVTADYPPPMGGIQVFTYELEQELKRSGHNVKVLNFDGRNLNTLSYLKLRDFFSTPATKTPYFLVSKLINPFNLFRIPGGYRDFVYKNMIYRKTKDIAKEFKPDLIHIMKNELYSAVFNTDIPYIVSCHSSNVDIYNAPHIKYSLKHAGIIHCVSNFTKKLALSIVNVDPKKIKVIYNFINLEKYKSKGIHKKRIITISRITRRKNLENLIHAYSRLPKEVQNEYEYMVVGGGEDLDALKTLTKKLNTKVTFTGEVTNEDKKIKLLSESEIFLLCPTPYLGEEETFGIVYIEAQALQVPIICSKCGGIPESVGKAGLYVNNELDPEEIKDKIMTLITNKKIRTELNLEAKKRIVQFNKTKWFNEILGMYREVIK